MTDVQAQIRDLAEQVANRCIEEDGPRRWCRVCDFEWHWDVPATSQTHGPDCIVERLLALLPIHGDERGRTAEEEKAENLGANGQTEVTPTSATRAGQQADSDARREDVEK